MISLGIGLAMLFVSRLVERGERRSRVENQSPSPSSFPTLPSNGEGSLFPYVIVSGFISYVVPNFVTFLVIPRIGSGHTAIMFALSPMMTAAVSTALKVRPPSALGILGIALGFLGALVIIFGRGDAIGYGSTGWLAVALLIPLFLGFGNVYRTLAWPKGAQPERLAAMTNLAAVLPLLVVAFALSGKLELQPFAAAPGLVAAQLLASIAMFLMFFRLQAIGGPTYLSQIGYVAAPVGVAIGVLFLGETYPAGVWIGAGVVAAGILISTYGQLAPSPSSLRRGGRPRSGLGEG
jgi:drug/metabolite transporter (DMT)-like permease